MVHFVVEFAGLELVAYAFFRPLNPVKSRLIQLFVYRFLRRGSSYAIAIVIQPGRPRAEYAGGWIREPWPTRAQEYGRR